MPLILGANSVSGYTVKNSLRFNSGSSDNLSKVFSSAETSNKIGTLSFWFKTLGTDQQYLVATNTGTIFYIYFNSSTGITFQNGVTTTRFTSQVFRDPSAWYHLVVAWDTSQGTASNRQKMYLNGSEITAFSTSNNLSLNQVIPFFDNDGSTKHIGSYTGGGYYSGYISEFYGIDGQQLTPSSFGETDTDTGIWKPKAYSGTYGTNGFKLEFKNSASLGTDTSGNGNNFTVNNLTSIDQTTDTPTNNFTTLNPLYSSSGTGFTNGNLDYQNTAVAWRSSLSNIAVNKGKWYAEFKYILRDNASADYGWAGICDVQQAETYSSTWLGDAVTSGTGIAYGTQSGDIYGNNVQLAVVSNPALNNIIGIAMDLDNNFVYFSLNGTFQNSGVPTSGASGTGGFAISTAVSKFYVFGTSSYDSSKWSAHFGNPAFTIASGNTDGAGYGNFEYAVPSGYYALNTKNLANFG